MQLLFDKNQVNIISLAAILGEPELASNIWLKKQQSSRSSLNFKISEPRETRTNVAMENSRKSPKFQLELKLYHVAELIRQVVKFLYFLFLAS